VNVPVAPGVTVAGPLVHDWVPDHAGSAGDADAVQAVAPVVVHVSDEDCPCPMVVGVAVSRTVGAVGELTVTETEAVLLPPEPVAVTVNVLSPAVAGVTVAVPLQVTDPDQSPEPEQLVAFLDVMVIVTDCPNVMVSDEAVTVTVGGFAGGVKLLPLPPPPPQDVRSTATKLIGRILFIVGAYAHGYLSYGSLLPPPAWGCSADLQVGTCQAKARRHAKGRQAAALHIQGANYDENDTPHPACVKPVLTI
jgi:hypothetical protein